MKQQQLHSPLPPTVPAFSELERICSFEEAIFEFTEGDYRLLDSAQPCRYSRITEFWDSVSPVPIIRRSPLGYSVPVYFSIPAAS